MNCWRTGSLAFISASLPTDAGGQDITVAVCLLAAQLGDGAEPLISGRRGNAAISLEAAEYRQAVSGRSPWCRADFHRGHRNLSHPPAERGLRGAPTCDLRERSPFDEAIRGRRCPPKSRPRYSTFTDKVKVCLGSPPRTR